MHSKRTTGAADDKNRQATSNGFCHRYGSAESTINKVRPEGRSLGGDQAQI
jgi:hypothetical protein